MIAAFSTPWGLAYDSEGAAEYLDIDSDTFRESYDRRYGIPHIRVSGKIIFPQHMLDQWREDNPVLGKRSAPVPDWRDRTRLSDVAQRLKAIGRPVISEGELRRANGIHESYWMDCMRNRPVKERPDFWNAAGIPFLTLQTAIEWSESYGLIWANESRQEVQHG